MAALEVAVALAGQSEKVRGARKKVTSVTWPIFACIYLILIISTVTFKR